MAANGLDISIMGSSPSLLAGADGTHWSVFSDAPSGAGKDPWVVGVQCLVHRTSDGIGGTPINALLNRSNARTTHWGLDGSAANFSNSAKQSVGVWSPFDIPWTPTASSFLVRLSNPVPYALTCRSSFAMVRSVSVGGVAAGSGLTKCFPGRRVEHPPVCKNMPPPLTVPMGRPCVELMWQTAEAPAFSPPPAVPNLSVWSPAWSPACVSPFK